jgi:hypothetical protein
MAMLLHTLGVDVLVVDQGRYRQLVEEMSAVVNITGKTPLQKRPQGAIIRTVIL